MVGDGLIENGTATEDGATAEVGIKLQAKESNRWWVSPPGGELQVGGRKPAMLSRSTTRSSTPSSE